MREIEISAMSYAPLSDATRSRLIDAGVDVDRIDSEPRSELWGQSILALAPGVRNDGAPACFASGYSPESEICVGCVWMARCWYRCSDYTSRMRELGPPPGVPAEVLKEFSSRASKKKPPPLGKRKPMPR